MHCALQFSAPVNSIFQLLVHKLSHSLHLGQHFLCMGGYGVFCFLKLTKEICLSWWLGHHLCWFYGIDKHTWASHNIQIVMGCVSNPQGYDGTDPSLWVAKELSSCTYVFLYLTSYRKDANLFNSQQKHILFLRCLHREHLLFLN